MVKNVEKHLSVRLLHPDKSGFAMTGYVLLFVPSVGINGHPAVSLPRRWRDQPLVDERAKPPPRRDILQSHTRKCHCERVERARQSHYKEG